MTQRTAVASPRPYRSVESDPEVGVAEDGAEAKLPPLTDGLSQSLVVFGRTFHVQTELCDGRLQTEIFLDGRLIANREARLDETELQAGHATQRKRMRAFHLRIVSGVLKRAERQQISADKQPESPEKDPEDSASSPSASSNGRQSTLVPAWVTDKSVDVSRRVRRLLEELRAHISTGEGREGERLDKACRAFAWVVSSPLFTQIRIDEQLSFHLLQGQMDAWQRDGRDPQRAVELWGDILNFVDYLEGIDNRAEFVDTDPGGPLESTSDPMDRDQTSATKNGFMEEVRAFPSPQSGSSHSHITGSSKEKIMAQANLEPLTAIDGFVGACLVDSDSGMMLGALGGGSVDLEIAAAGNTQVVRAKRKTMDSLKLDDHIEDILISLKGQYHLIRILESNQGIFLYLMLDRGKANLAMARHELRSFESSLNIG